MDDVAAKSLFDIAWLENANAGRHDLPYGMRLECELDREPQRYHEDELSVFEHVTEHEIGDYERRGHLYGLIKLDLHYVDAAYPLSLPVPAGHIRLPSVADPEFVQIIDCHATDLILVESYHIFSLLTESKVLADRSTLIMTGAGVPRMTARKLLRRFQKELGIRIHLLSDNDTWSYFIYSLLLRGAMGPHAFFPWAALETVNYIGIRAGEHETCGVPTDKLRPWEDIWSSRLNALRTYTCFQSAEWQAELDAFEQQHYAVNLLDLIESMGGVDSFASSYLLPRM